MLDIDNNEINYYQLYNINKWSIEEISKFSTFYNNSKKNKDCLHVIYEYKLPFNQVKSLNEKELQKIGIQNFYEKTYDRDIDELLIEHSSILKEKEMDNNTTEDHIISQRVKNIKALSNVYKDIKITKETINDPNNKDLKNKEDDLIAIINNGVKSIKGYQLRDSQIYALLVLLNKKQYRGKIAQILTGEGKTIIINCLAIILALKGHKVDIVTSNPILAIRDSEESEELYNYFGISVSNNVNEKKEIMKYIKGDEDNCYTKDILYGTTFEYQGDILDDEYNLSGVRKNRGYDVVIVDEIDSMLIDEYASKTRLASSKPFLEKYSVLLLLLWAFYKRLNLDDDEVVQDEQLKEELKKYLKGKIVNIINSKENFISLSQIGKKFALDQVDKWIDSLIRSLSMKKDDRYIIKNDQIIPVDQDNTGVIQKATTLSYGLHQFLQMKNNLPVTPISIMTNYLSNLGFFKKYIKSEGNFIYGMSGTLGSKKARELLGDIYGLDFDYIPPNSTRILRELTSCISFDKHYFNNNIIRIVKRETNGGRGILLICENIDSVNKIYEELNIHCQNLNLIKIIGDDDEKQKIPSSMKPNTVIISTNISGRGTDLKLGEEILKNGGLHVIITFIPNNCRVEEQNYGRAGRKGEPGTWQLVINYQEEMGKYYELNNLEEKYVNYAKICKSLDLFTDLNVTNFMNDFSIDCLRNLREKRELSILDNSRKFIDKVDKEDYLFNLYCGMINEKKELREDENSIYLESIEEKWAIFLYNLNLTNKSREQVYDEFNKFKNEILRELKDGTIVKNPGFYNRYVNKKLSLIIENEQEKSMKDQVVEGLAHLGKKIKSLFIKDKNIDSYEEYIKKCNYSIKLDPNSFIPYYLRAICKILKKEEGLEDLKSSLQYIKEEKLGYQKLYILLQSLCINTTFPYNQLHILNNIENQIINQNIIDYKNLKASDLIIKKKRFDEIFSFRDDDGSNKDRIIPEYLKKYFYNIRDNGLNYFFFLKEKVSILKVGLMLGGAGLLIGLSVLSFGILPAIGAAVITGISAIIGGLAIVNGLDDLFTGEHDRYFKDSYDINFFNFLKRRKKIRKFYNLNLDEICNKYDLEFQKKKNKEEEKNFKNNFVKKYRKVQPTDEERKLLEDISDNVDEKKIEKRKEELKNKLNKDEKKAIVGNNIMKSAGKDFIDKGKDVHEKINQNQKELKDIFDKAIKSDVKEKYKEEIEKEENEFKQNLQNLNEKEMNYKKEEKKVNDEIEKINKKQKEHNEKCKNHSNKIKALNKETETENEKNRKLEQDVKQYNEKMNKINNGQKNIIISEDEKKKLDDRITEMKKAGEKINEKRNQLNSEADKLNKEQDELDREKEKCQKKIDEVEKEKNDLNNEIEESNQKKDLLNEKINFYNNLEDHLDFDIKGENFQLKLKNKPNIELKGLNTILKKVEDNVNLAFDKELEILAKKEIDEENEKKYNLVSNGVEERLQKINQEKHCNWDNCFNKSVFPDKYKYTYDDMKKIVKFDSKKYRDKLDFYYISDLENLKNLEKLKNYLDNKKIVFGNYYNSENKSWDCFAIIPNDSNYSLLYKSSSGKNPPEKFMTFFKNKIGNNYEAKINKKIENPESKFSEVDAIENIKIMIDEISKNKNEFIKDFTNFKNFYKEDNEQKKEKKEKIYPKTFIKSVYDSKKKRNKSSRISLGLFREYFTNEEKPNEIELDFFNQIYDILINYDEIDNKEKEILKKEYQDIKNSYYKIKFNGNDIVDDNEEYDSKKNIESDKKEDNKDNSFNYMKKENKSSLENGKKKEIISNGGDIKNSDNENSKENLKENGNENDRLKKNDSNDENKMKNNTNNNENKMKNNNNTRINNNNDNYNSQINNNEIKKENKNNKNNADNQMSDINKNNENKIASNQMGDINNNEINKEKIKEDIKDLNNSKNENETAEINSVLSQNKNLINKGNIQNPSNIENNVKSKNKSKNNFNKKLNEKKKEERGCLASFCSLFKSKKK